VDHIIRLRETQDKSGGFLAFVPLAFQPKHTELAHIPPTSGMTDLQVLATARLMLDNFQHIRQMWNYVDEKLIHVALGYGVDDLGSTNFDETIAKAAGSQSKSFTYQEVIATVRGRSGLTDEILSAYFKRLKHEFEPVLREELLLYLENCRELGWISSVPELAMTECASEQLTAGSA
jgi:2-iminoacetate synthase ThiH